jgi:hypothetical protein
LGLIIEEHKPTKGLAGSLTLTHWVVVFFFLASFAFPWESKEKRAGEQPTRRTQHTMWIS